MFTMFTRSKVIVSDIIVIRQVMRKMLKMVPRVLRKDPDDSFKDFC